MKWVWCKNLREAILYFVCKEKQFHNNYVTLGNDFNGITIQSKGIIERAKAINYPFTEEDNKYTLKSPDGYTFYVLDNQNTEKIGEYG